MTDRERLKALVKKSLIKHIDKTCMLAENITDDLLANGVGVMPCKVGDSVYCIENRERIVKTYMVDCMRFEWFKSCTEVILTAREPDVLNFYREFTSYHIGKTVFFTKEEAEEKLKELKR